MGIFLKKGKIDNLQNGGRGCMGLVVEVQSQFVFVFWFFIGMIKKIGIISYFERIVLIFRKFPKSDFFELFKVSVGIFL